MVQLTTAMQPGHLWDGKGPSIAIRCGGIPNIVSHATCFSAACYHTDALMTLDAQALLDVFGNSAGDEERGIRHEA